MSSERDSNSDLCVAAVACKRPVPLEYYFRDSIYRLFKEREYGHQPW